MAEFNLDYYSNEDLYSDGDIENTMLEMAKEGVTLQQVDDDQLSFPILYHFSDVRKNILCWYPFKKTDAVLEIGSGCGAITGLLCEKAGRVTSVELSKRRAEINFNRNHDKDNLTIMVGNFNDMIFQEKFDYVIVNGVLEYAISFTEGDTPYKTFLEKMCSYLKDDGKIIVAIENKLGLKYFSGAPEDHTDLHFFGINGYPQNKSVRTFSKTELTSLLRKGGFPFAKYYYPYPDYKFPTEIYSDDYMDHNMFEKAYPEYKNNILDLFDEQAGGEALLKEKILDRFANSFLVVAGKKELEFEENVLYVKMNRQRKEQYQIMTKIMEQDGRKYVVKEAMTEEAVPFLKDFSQRGEISHNNKYVNLQSEYKDGSVSYRYLYGRSMEYRIRECMKEQNAEKIEKILDDFYDNYFAEKKEVEMYQGEEFCQVFGNYPGKSYYECVSPANVDVICTNIIQEGKKDLIIDYEWIFDFPVPVAFIMWRMLHELYICLPKLEKICPKTKIMEKYDIQKSDREIFLNWSKHFAYEYVGCDFLNKFAKPRIPVHFNEIVQTYDQKQTAASKLYYEVGKGLAEDQVITKDINLENEVFKVTFDLSKIQGITALRWNPYGGRMFSIEIDAIDSDRRIGLIPWGPHIIKDEKTTIFLSKDGCFFLESWDFKDLKEITIYGKIHRMQMDEVDTLMYRKFDEKMAALQRQREIDIREAREAEEARAAEAAAQAAAEEAARIAEENEPPAWKKILKRIFREDEPQVENSVAQPEVEEPQVVRPVCIGASDEFIYEDHTLRVAGWAYDTGYIMEHKRIAFYYQDQKIKDFKYHQIFRKDVAESLNTPEAEDAGFTQLICISTPFPLQVYFEYDTEIGLGQLHLGDVEPNIEGDKIEDIVLFIPEDANSIANIVNFEKANISPKRWKAPMELLQQKVDIIIPIYNGLEYFDSLFRSIEKTHIAYRLILVDDKSPDPRVTKYLDDYAKEHDNVILLRNEQNLGFVRSVNAALKIAENHIALVNSDVEVPEEWLERLMYPIFFKPNIASTTPFTTCGTICSFPNFCQDNPIFEGMKLWQIDEEFRRVIPEYTKMPTGVGFCMGMNLNVVRQIGLLDDEAFEKGYGEENDWCQRALKAGYQNVHVENLFVYHKHGGSFPSEEKARLIQQNAKKLLEKHPDYNAQVAGYCEKDPVRLVRLYVIMQLLKKRMDIPVTVCFDHSLGGGATEYLNEKIKLELKAGHCVLTIRYNIEGSNYQLLLEYKEYRITCYTLEFDEMLDQIARADEIWINELVTYKNLYDTLVKIIEFKNKHHAKVKMLLHDFFCMCPAINLMDDQGVYCHAADPEKCDLCIPKNPSTICQEYESGGSWRRHWKNFLANCEEVIAFSDDTARSFEKVYPDIYSLKVIPHKPHYVTPIEKKAKTTKTLNIGLMGVLCYKKGLEIVKAMISYIEKNDLDVRIRLIGVSEEEIDSPVFSMTGRYSKEQLPLLTLKEDIDFFLVPSICPETYSYTTSEIMSMDMPIGVFQIGAPAERVRHYKKGLILKSEDPKYILEEISKACGVGLHGESSNVHKEKVLFVIEEVSFASRYRVEHFMEQLLCSGYDSHCIMMDERDTVNVRDYHGVVLYRCKDVEGTRELVEQAHEAGKKVYYDVDDYVFDYQAISYLDFLKEKEYSDFQERTEKVHQCMELCDEYLTSTNTLAEVIRKEFPEKTTTINRNCMSMEMQILSHDAVECTDKDPEKIVIGYFSGSRTHDNDFAILENVLLELMEKYPQISLKMVGELSQQKWKRMEKRIEKLPFMDWRKLPGVYASVDINLMPLEDTLFHCCKSENKWTEAALVKVPSVMSRNKEMESVLVNGEDALLCRNEEEWKKALELLITDQEKRVALGERAYLKVMENYVTQKTGKEAREEILCNGRRTK